MNCFLVYFFYFSCFYINFFLVYLFFYFICLLINCSLLYLFFYFSRVFGGLNRKENCINSFVGQGSDSFAFFLFLKKQKREKVSFSLKKRELEPAPFNPSRKKHLVYFFLKIRKICTTKRASSSQIGGSWFKPLVET